MGFVMAQKTQELDVGKRISGWRRQKGLTQVVVAQRAGVAASYLSRIEGGKVHPTVRTAARIADALRMSLDDLLGQSPVVKRGHPCPASVSGSCLMDLLDTSKGSRSTDDRERYTPRQLRVLRRFSALLQKSEPKMLSALEMLVGQLLKDGSPRRN